MKIHAVVSALCVAILAGCATGTDSPEGTSNKARLLANCMSMETKEAMAGSPSKAPLSESAAKDYAEYVCNAAAATCARDPTQPTCQRELKKYGLTQ
jgi:hypothetical protein